MNILKESEKSYDELVELNRMLEKKLAEEIAKNKEKDHFFIQQSRHAAMGEMVGSIGHHWRQPINSLTLLVQDLRDALEFGEITELYLDRFTKDSMDQIQHMTGFLNDLRKFYLPNKEKRFSVSDAIEDALSIFSPCLKSHDIGIEFVHRGQPLTFGYPNDYRLAVLNVLLNAKDAFDYREQHNRKIQIQIYEEANFLAAQFTYNADVREPASHFSMFEPNFTQQTHGSGLRYYFTNTVVANMNGCVKAENTGDGTSITLLVPKASRETIGKMD